MRVSSLFHALGVAAGVLFVHGTVHAQTTFDLDPANSSLTITTSTFSENVGGMVVSTATLGAQAAGSTVSGFVGTITATLDSTTAPTSITFDSAAASATETGAYSPVTNNAAGGSGPGGSGANPADYGLAGSLTGTVTGTLDAAFDGLGLSLTSTATTVSSSGNFALAGISVPATANYGYRSATTSGNGTLRGGGPFADGNPATPTDASGSTGSYAVANGVATLTIPIDVTYTVTSTNFNTSGTATFTNELVGTLVATANVPEPSTWALLGLGSVAVGGWFVRRRA